MKTKNTFFCQSCGFESPKWLGKCPSCNEWNTFVEETRTVKSSKSTLKAGISSKPQLLNEIESHQEPRIITGSSEFDRVLGGGIVPGSLILLGGEPGIGKSTLLLQIALKQNKLSTLYVSGEESLQQIKLRADRIGINNDDCYVISETDLDAVLNHITQLQPGLVVIDSIQTLNFSVLDSSPGSVSQVRECTARLLRFAKENGIPMILVGHITKDGTIAGPKVLEHIVDVVIQFEGDQHYMYRMLRSVKNRFGSTSELGIFEMQGKGLIEVTNPSEILLSQNSEPLSGTAVAATVEGVRPILIEVQALVSSAAYGTPQRSSTGFDLRRLAMLLAVLEKRAGFKLALKDVFLNIAGGIRVEDPAVDLAVVSAILSSGYDVFLGKDVCFAGEVGLTGEIRPVARIEQRVSEAEKLGMKQIILSKYSKKGIDYGKYKIQPVFIGKIEDLVRAMFS